VPARHHPASQASAGGQAPGTSRRSPPVRSRSPGRSKVRLPSTSAPLHAVTLSDTGRHGERAHCRRSVRRSARCRSRGGRCRSGHSEWWLGLLPAAGSQEAHPRMPVTAPDCSWMARLTVAVTWLRSPWPYCSARCRDSRWVWLPAARRRPIWPGPAPGSRRDPGAGIRDVGSLIEGPCSGSGRGACTQPAEPLATGGWRWC
jgi:hypothetical protein